MERSFFKQRGTIPPFRSREDLTILGQSQNKFCVKKDFESKWKRYEEDDDGLEAEDDSQLSNYSLQRNDTDFLRQSKFNKYQSISKDSGLLIHDDDVIIKGPEIDSPQKNITNPRGFGRHQGALMS